MFKNYFKTAIRNVLKNKVTALINVVSLGLGIASVFLISIYISHELGFDRHYPGAENLYRVVWDGENPQTRTPHPMAQALVNDFAEVEQGVSLSPLWGAGLTRRVFSFRNAETNIRFDEAAVLSVDSTFFKVFGLPLLRGDGARALKSVNGILLSESASKRYFGNADPIGKFILVDGDSALLEVMAVFNDIPAQSHFHADFLISYVREKSFDPDDAYYTWADFGHYNYVRLKPGTDAQALESKLLDWSRKYLPFSEEAFTHIKQANSGFHLQPVTDIHLNSHLRWELEANGNIDYIYIMGGAGLLTLIIACINFMNLMTARSAERAREIGIRKTLGAVRKQLAFQFISEATVITFVSMLVALLIVEVALPVYNLIAGYSFELSYRQTLPILVGLALFISVAAAIYPSFVLSSLSLPQILKGKFSGNQGGSLRQILIVFQFAMSMILVSGAALIFHQLTFLQNRSLGFDKESVLTIPVRNENLNGRMEAIKNAIAAVPGVLSVSASSNLPGGAFNQDQVHAVEFPNASVDFSEAFVDYDLARALDIEMAEGAFFDAQTARDSLRGFVINEAGVKALMIEEPVGKEIVLNYDEMEIRGVIRGVMKDFHFQSLHEPVKPLLLAAYPAYNHIVVKLSTNDLSAKVEQIKKVYSTFENQYDFEYSFLDAQLDAQYKAEERTGIIFGIFAFIAVMIACFGLFGIALIAFKQKTKEVCIRKVVGANIIELMVLLLKDFTKLVAIAVLIATPLVWYMMDKWLNNFSYQITISPLVFIGSGLLLVVLAWITLGSLTIKTAAVNPAETLRSE